MKPNGMHFPFGPFLWQTTLDIDVVDDLLDKTKNTIKYHNDKLAGIIDEEHKFSDEDTSWFANKTSSVIKEYLNPEAAVNEIYFKKNSSTTHTFNTSTGSIKMVNNGYLDNSVNGRLFLLDFGNGVHIGDTTAFNTAGGMGHGDETLTYDHFVLRWDVEHTGSYVGQHIAGGQADYKNNYAMIGFSTEPGNYANHTTSFSMTS